VTGLEDELMPSYVSDQDALRTRLLIHRSGAQLIEAWSEFVAACEEGYAWDISEYRNELRVRGEIEQIMIAGELQVYREHAGFCGAVEGVDARFRLLGRPDWQFPDRTTWWERLVPARAGEALATYCRAVYGFPVEVAAVNIE